MGIRVRFDSLTTPFRAANGTGQQVVPPEFLGDHRPDVVIVMNAIYRTEIERILESLGVHAEIIQA